MAARTVALAVKPEVMPEVAKILGAGAMHLSAPVAREERLRVHKLDEPVTPTARVVRRSPDDVAEELGVTPRMLQLLQLISLGLSVDQAAHRMGIERYTAKTHAARLYRQLKVKGGAPEAVAVGYRKGLLTGGEA
ncbi:LuxR C-terminal-related transcriptional regulator [Amycolatopsis sp. cmx-4-83]|uniref:helix-turn-helix transcriptional regulator n=1 Tax=Amycolatopsis sp. cmx-4-83 TaxID=2790940 RepID=UPI00397AFBD9